MEKYYRPTSVADACQWLSDHEGSEIIAGGQTMTLHLREGLKSPATLVDVSEIDSLRGIAREDGRIVIGSAVTYAELERSETVRTEFPYFADAISHIAGPQVRHNGTVGGGLCYGDPALDTPPVLLTLDSMVHLISADGSRTLPLSEFYTGYYETALEQGELLTQVEVPTLPERSAGTYLTMTPRQGDYAIAGVATRLTLDEDGVCETARVALTNAGDVPLRATEAEKALAGTHLERDDIDEATTAVRDATDILEDIQTPKSYRETIFQRLARQSFIDVRDSIRGDN